MNLVFSSEKKLSEDEIIQIKSRLKRAYTPTNQSVDNLILIIVESLMTFPIDLFIDGIEITPTLNKLKNEGYYNPNMVSQIEKGMSSDGQFIYFTGILPHKNNITIIDYIKNEYNGIGEYAFKKGIKTIMIVPTTHNFWRQEQACQKYGIDELWSKEKYQYTQDYTSLDEWLNDEQIFNYSSWICKQTTSPFFLTILTSSMHMPYYSTFDKAKIKLSSQKYSHEYINYLQKVNYTDHQLGLLIYIINLSLLLYRIIKSH